MASLLSYVLPTLLGLLGQFMVAFLGNLVKARAHDPQLYALILQLVTDANTKFTADQGAEKRAFVLNAVKAWLVQAGKEVGDSAINALIELAVQKQKQ